MAGIPNHKAFENRNPADTSELIGNVSSSTNEDVDLAVNAATEAYKSWRLVPAPTRGDSVSTAELLVRRKDDLARDITREMGKILTENAR